MDKKKLNIIGYLVGSISIVAWLFLIGKLDRGIGGSMGAIFGGFIVFLGITFIYWRLYDKKEIFGRVFGIISGVSCPLLYMQHLDIFWILLNNHSG